LAAKFALLVFVSAYYAGLLPAYPCQVCFKFISGAARPLWSQARAVE
jgi:hypothetical protein